MYKACMAVVLILCLNVCFGSSGDTEGNSFVDLQGRAEHIALVRVVSARWIESDEDNCRYEYAINSLHSYKGRFPSLICYSSPLVIGNRYLIVGNIKINRLGQAVLGFLGLPAAYPLLPYGLEVPGSEAWVAVGGAEYNFPQEVRQTGEGSWKACHISVSVGWSDPCLVPPPLVMFADVDKLLQKLNAVEKGR